VSRGEAAALAAVGALAVAVALISPWSPLVQATAPEGQQGLTWAPWAPVAHYARGGLYHPPLCGEGRSNLIRHGWAWIYAPPSEITDPGLES
jgi:hypothetical protein